MLVEYKKDDHRQQERSYNLINKASTDAGGKGGGRKKLDFSSLRLGRGGGGDPPSAIRIIYI